MTPLTPTPSIDPTIPAIACNGQQRRKFFVVAGVLTALFAVPLYLLVRLALHSELHSHLLLIPFVTWFVWRFIDSPTTQQHNQPSRSAAVAVAVGSLFFSVAFVAATYIRHRPNIETLWLAILGYLLALLAAALATLGWGRLRDHQFALSFLVFFPPLPPAVMDAMSRLLQSASAEAADWFIHMTGLPVLRSGMMFQMPGLSIRVAEECSGLRSTLMLFITSTLAAKLFLQTTWRRSALALAVIPLGIARNAVRITALSWLTVNVDSGIINGWLHHQGGPVFFVLSLVPLFILLWWLRRSESVRQKH